MRLRRLLPSLLAGATLLGCTNLDLTDPNEPSTDTFWQTAADAVAGVNAVYNGLQNNGTYGRWLVFASDLRSDVGLINSPWTDLSNFTKFTFTSYDFEVNHDLWQHHYQAIFRANQRSEEHTSELQSQSNLVCRLLLEKKKNRAHVNSLDAKAETVAIRETNVTVSVLPNSHTRL